MSKKSIKENEKQRLNSLRRLTKAVNRLLKISFDMGYRTAEINLSVINKKVTA